MKTFLTTTATPPSQSTPRKAKSSDYLAYSQGFASPPHIRACLSDKVLTTQTSPLGRRVASALDISLVEVGTSSESLRKLATATFLSNAAVSGSDSEQVCSPRSQRTTAIHADAHPHSDKSSDSVDYDLSCDDAGFSVDMDEEALVFVAERKRVNLARQPLSATAVNFARYTVTAPTRRISVKRPIAGTDEERAQPSDVPTEASCTNDESTSHQSHLNASMDDAEEVRLYHADSLGWTDASQSLHHSSADDASQPLTHFTSAITKVQVKAAVSKRDAVESVEFELLEPLAGEDLHQVNQARGDGAHIMTESSSISDSTFAMEGWSLVKEAKIDKGYQGVAIPSSTERNELLRKSSMSSIASHSSFPRQIPYFDQFAPKSCQDSALVQTARFEEQRKEAGILAQQRSSIETLSSASGTLRSPSSYLPATGDKQTWNGNSSSSNDYEEVKDVQKDEHSATVRPPPSHIALFVPQQTHDFFPGRAKAIAPSGGSYSELSGSSLCIRTLHDREPSQQGHSLTQFPPSHEGYLSAKDATSPRSASFDKRSNTSRDTFSPSVAETDRLCKLKSSSNASKADLDWDGELGHATVRAKKSFFGRSRRTSQTSIKTAITATSNNALGQPNSAFSDSGGIQTLHITKGMNLKGEASSRPSQRGPPSPAFARSSVTAPSTPSGEHATRPTLSKQRSKALGRWSDAINPSRYSRSSVNGGGESIEFPPCPGAEPQPQSPMQKQRTERPNYPPSSSQTRPSFIRSPSIDSLTSSMESGRTSASGRGSLLNRIGIASRRSKSSKGSIGSSSIVQDDRPDHRRSPEYGAPIAPSSSRRETSESTTEEMQDRPRTSGGQSAQHDVPAYPLKAKGKPNSMRHVGSLTTMKNAFDVRTR